MHVPKQNHHQARQYPVGYKMSESCIHICGGHFTSGWDFKEGAWETWF